MTVWTDEKYVHRHFTPDFAPKPTVMTDHPMLAAPARGPLAARTITLLSRGSATPRGSGVCRRAWSLVTG